MADRFEKLGIVVETTGIGQAKAELLGLGDVGDAAAKKVAASFAQNQAAARQAASTFATQLRTAFDADMARVREGIARGLLNPQEARRAGVEAGREFNQGILSQLDNLGGVGLNSSNSKVYRDLASELKTVGDVAQRSGHGFGQLSQELLTVTRTAVGVEPVVGQLAYAIGNFGLSAPMMIGVLGGIAALAYEYRLLTGDTRKAKEEQERLNKVRNDFLSKIGRPGGELGASQTGDSEESARLLRERNKAQEEYDALLTRQAANEQGLGLLIGQKLVQLNKLKAEYAAVSNAATLEAQETQRLKNALNEAMDQGRLEVEHQKALNAAYGQGQLALDKINIEYAYQSKLISDAAQYKNADRVTMDELAKATRDASVAAAENSAGVGELRSKIAELNGALPGLQSGFDALQPSMMSINRLWQDQLTNVKLLKDAYPDIVKDIRRIGAENEQITKRQVDQAAAAIRAQERYSDDMHRIWRDGFGAIVTDGLKSFQDMTEDIFRLFTRLMDRMKQEGKDSGLGYNLLGLGAAAVGGAAAGYGTGSAAGGLITGAITGAFATGNPIGALVGGLAGLTGGLIGGAQAAKERKEAEDRLRESLNATVAGLKNQVGLLSDVDLGTVQIKAQILELKKATEQTTKPGAERVKAFNELNDLQDRLIRQLQDNAIKKAADFWGAIADQMNALEGPSGAFYNTLAQIDRQYRDNVATARTLGASESDLERIRQLSDKQIEDAIATYQHQLQQTRDSYQLRILNANGDSDASFALQQQIERAAAIADRVDDLTLAYLDSAQTAERAQREREKQTQLLQGQLATAQQTLEQNKAVVDSLTSFKNGLALSQYSPLSPRQQLDAARQQLSTVYNAALGGDVNAGNQFSSVAQQFLESSRRYNASGAGYVLDYNSVNVMTDALQKAFGDRVSDAQQQVNLLQAQLDKLTGVQQSIIDLGTTLIMVNTQLGTLQQGLTKATVDEIQEVNETITETSRDIVRGLEAIRSVAGDSPRRSA